MRRTISLALLASALLMLLPALFVQAEESSWGEADSIDKYIGRELLEGNRAAVAGVVKPLPLACPPFFLRDEFGNIIDPTLNPEVSAPVSTKQTCKKCHDWDTITMGYHFQMGYDELTPEVDSVIPDDLDLTGEVDEDAFGLPALHRDRGPGYYGRWSPLTQHEVAPLNVDDAAEIDMTPFEWIPEIGIYHPGGGPAEYDRAGRRYDRRAINDRTLRDSNNGDYHGADWDKTGVVEADCFICHLDSYEYSDRAQQLKKGNYKWASTVAAGFASIEGAVNDNEQPKLTYNKGVFGPDGKVRLHIRRPSDRQCNYCHDMLGTQKRGTGWHNVYVQDVHTQQKVACTECHTSDIRHNFAKGSSSNHTMRDDIDNSIETCAECHEEGELGAPPYDHPGIPPIHFERMACTTCHITKRPFLHAQTVDALTGKVVATPNQVDEAMLAAYELGAHWGMTKGGEEIFEPMPANVIAKAAASSEVQGLLEDGNVKSDAAREAMLTALAANLGDEDGTPICIYQGDAYQIRLGALVKMTTTLNPPRVNTITEYPVYYSRAKGEKGKIFPETTLLGVYWVFLDGDMARPIFPREMEAAWAFLHQNDENNAVYDWDTEEDTYYRFYTAVDSEEEEPVEGEDPKIKIVTEKTSLDIHDDNNDVWAEVNTDDEIGLMAWALQRTSLRLNGQPLYYVKGHSIYEVTVEDGAELAVVEERTEADTTPYQLQVQYKKGKSKFQRAEERKGTLYTASITKVDADAPEAIAEMAEPWAWTISHGVEPVSMALGAKSCAECHDDDAHFFAGEVITDPFGPDGKPVKTTMAAVLGYSQSDITSGEFREEVLKPFAPWIILFILVIMYIHFVIYGPHGTHSDEPLVLDRQRMNLMQRLAHMVAKLTMIVLLVTGILFLLGKHDPLGGTLAIQARTLHTLVGYVAVAGLVFMFVAFVKDMFYKKGDAKWLAGAGGYLSGYQKFPSGKFNAGQKMLFWLVILDGAALAITGVLMGLNRNVHMASQSMLYTIHDIAALVMILMMFGHIYLAVIVNAHSIFSLFGGKVSSKWGKEHHPDW